MFEHLNSPSTGVLVSGNGSPCQTSNSSSNSKSYSFSKAYKEDIPEAMREIVDEVRRYMIEQGNDVSESVLKQCLAIKKTRNIVCIVVNQTYVHLFLKLDPDTVELTDTVTDARGKSHWGTGDLECTLSTMDELEYVKPLLERAYLEN